MTEANQLIRPILSIALALTLLAAYAAAALFLSGPLAARFFPSLVDPDTVAIESFLGAIPTALVSVPLGLRRQIPKSIALAAWPAFFFIYPYILAAVFGASSTTIPGWLGMLAGPVIALFFAYPFGNRK